MKTLAMVLERFNAPLVAREVEIPALEEGQVLVRMEAAGICGSDVHMWKGHDERTPLPIILGHEGIGRVEEVKGARFDLDGRRIEPGDRILWNRGIECGECFYCAVVKEPSLCSNRRVYGINRPFTEPPYLNGCYAQHVILTKNTDLIRVEDTIDPTILVPASCSGATVAHGIAQRPPQPGETILVQGPGPLGLFAVAFARDYGAKEIIVIGGSPNRLELCKEMGATCILNRRTMSIEERRQAILDLTNGRGVDLAIEAVGQPSAVPEGLDLLRHGGTYLSVGFSQPPGEVSVDFFRQIVRKNARVQGVWVSDASHLSMSAALVLKNKELFAKIITHRFALEQADAGLAAMDSHEALKAVLIPAGA